MVNSKFVELKFASAKIAGMTMDDQAKMFLVIHCGFVHSMAKTWVSVVTTVYGALLVMLNLQMLE